MAPLMFDVCCGEKGASQAMVARGWDVITLDIDPKFQPDILADVCTWQPPTTGERPLLVWCSPPCTEFAREFMPWCKTGKAPDLSIMLACRRIIQSIKPHYWVIENVKGAIRWFEPYLGPYRYCNNPFYLWGFFPLLGKVKLNMRKKESFSSTNPEARAKIPRALSVAVALACEKQKALVPLGDL